MAKTRVGRQTPTAYVVLPYKKSKGKEAICLYQETGRKAQPWQKNLIKDILAYSTGKKELWKHTKVGYSVPRRNGKNEIVAIRELFALFNGEKALHTAHRTTTSHAASVRLAQFLSDMGYEEVQRVKRGEVYDKHYTYSKQYGLERIVLLREGGGSVDFRTRSGKGGLGEGFDLLIIDEAQEYTDEQESALKYVVTDSQNPQTIFCGTPPTPVSSGTVFLNFRNKMLEGGLPNSAWAEWSVDDVSDIHDRDLWYFTNPSLGYTLTERAVADELGGDEIDFNIQRLGLWIQYSLKSAISEAEWMDLKVDKLPKIKSRLFVGIKYGVDGTHTAMTIAVKTDTGDVFIEGIDCMTTRSGNSWIMTFLRNADIEKVVIDGKNGQELLKDDMKKAKLKKPVLPTVAEVINAHSSWEIALEAGTIKHMAQPAMVASVTNCEKRSIGTNGGWGYKSLNDDIDVALLESAVLAHWACIQSKEKRIQKVYY